MSEVRSLLLAALVAIVLGVLVFRCADARAQGAQCLPRDAALSAALSRYGEVPAFIAKSDSGVDVLVTVAPDGNWTLWAAPSPDVLCMIVSGREWIGAASSSPAPKLAPSYFMFQRGGIEYRRV